MCVFVSVLLGGYTTINHIQFPSVGTLNDVNLAGGKLRYM